MSVIGFDADELARTGAWYLTYLRVKLPYKGAPPDDRLHFNREVREVSESLAAYSVYNIVEYNERYSECQLSVPAESIAKRIETLMAKPVSSALPSALTLMRYNLGDGVPAPVLDFLLRLMIAAVFLLKDGAL